jgi:hypothetical protein
MQHVCVTIYIIVTQVGEVPSPLGNWLGGSRGGEGVDGGAEGK